MRQIYFLSLFFIITSCKKESLSWSEGPQWDFIVEGGISTLDSVQYIKLSRPFLLFEEDAADLDSAIVTVSNGTDVFYFKQTADKGVYRGIVPVRADGPTVYHLTIHSEGNTYEATDSLFKFMGGGNAVMDKFVVEGSTVKINYAKHNFGRRNAGLFLLQRAPSTWQPFPKEGSPNYSYSHPFGAPNALGQILSPSISHVFNTTDSVDLYFFSVSPAYSKFLYGVFRETDWKGLLSSASGNVKGNMSGNAGGFFYVMDGVKRRRSLPKNRLAE